MVEKINGKKLPEEVDTGVEPVLLGRKPSELAVILINQKRELPETRTQNG